MQARPGRGNARRPAGKGEPGREGARGIGSRSAGSARTGGDCRGEPWLPPGGGVRGCGEAGDGRRFWGWRGAVSAFSETTARLHDLDKLAKANSGSLLLPQSWQRLIFYFVTNRKKCLALQSSFVEETCRLFLSLPAQLRAL